MALIKCPKCGRMDVSDKAIKCPGCGFPINSQIKGEMINDTSYRNINNTGMNNAAISGNLTHNKKYNKIIIVSILVFAVLYMYSSTLCEYSGCLNRKMSGSKYCITHSYKYINSTDSRSYSSTEEADSRSSYQLKISNVYVYTNSVSTYCTGKITNNGSETFRFVKVKGSFMDGYGKTIETGDSYAVGSEGLAPGESTSFTIYCDCNSRVESCTVTVYDYD